MNCVYELLLGRPVARAKELDEHFAKNGLPISVKEHNGMEDLDDTCGLVG